MIRPLLSAGTLLLLPAILAVQEWKTDPNARRLAWGNANVVMRSDTASGLQIWASTSRVLHPDTPSRSFAARFDPDSIMGWLAYANRLLEASTKPTDPKAKLQTPSLRGLDGSQIYLIRGQKDGKWAPRVSVVFAASEAISPWSVLANKSATRDFLEDLFIMTTKSFYRPEIKSALYEPNPADTMTCPRPLSQPRLSYPANRQYNGQMGDVWLTFVVRADSTIDPTSVTVLVSDGVEFTASAVRAVKSVRYQPVTRNGQPVDALAFQRVSFLLSK
jgi:TonB family protein